MKEFDPKRELFEDIFAESVNDAVRRRSLTGVVRYARQRRRRRIAGRVGGSFLCLIGFMWLLRLGNGQESGPKSIASGPAVPSVVQGTPIRVISDEELFALFADRSVAMVTVNEQTWFTTLD